MSSILNFKVYLLAACFVIAINSKPAVANTLDKYYLLSDTIQRVEPPLLEFYSKFLNCNGIAIRSGSVVDDEALHVAYSRVLMMTRHMDIASKNLVKNGAELHIIGRYQQTSDLPEHADEKGVKYKDKGAMTDIDMRTRGVGGLYASCGEENLLHLSNDRYGDGSDICVHEFAHTIMGYGFDDKLRQKIKQQYHQAIKNGLWKDAYAATNEMEYWAELSEWYFGAHGEFLRGTHLPQPGVKGLMKYDAGGYKLMDSIYSGLLQPVLQGLATAAVQKGTFSGAGVEKTEFTLLNKRTNLVKVYWIDYTGKPVLYATIPPQGHMVQQTFVSHVWMFEDAKGIALCYLRIGNPPNNIELHDEY
jgi:hypothetical protein